MPHPLLEASLQVVAGHSLVVPLIVEGLPEEIEALGERWQRKLEFHLTAVSARKLEGAAGDHADLWRRVTTVASGRALGPIGALDEVRRVSDPRRPGLRTLIVMADARGLDALHHDLSCALGVALRSPPAHVTLYSSDREQGIGIDDAAELRHLAPELSAAQQDEVRAAIRFSEVFA
jgi:hypothetical protein